ncbi:hypothetical protein ACFL56_03740 [Candidatus Margulisiibacteriota bacterium]
MLYNVVVVKVKSKILLLIVVSFFIVAVCHAEVVVGPFAGVSFAQDLKYTTDSALKGNTGVVFGVIGRTPLIGDSLFGFGVEFSYHTFSAYARKDLTFSFDEEVSIQGISPFVELMYPLGFGSVGARALYYNPTIAKDLVDGTTGTELHPFELHSGIGGGIFFEFPLGDKARVRIAYQSYNGIFKDTEDDKEYPCRQDGVFLTGSYDLLSFGDDEKVKSQKSKVKTTVERKEEALSVVESDEKEVEIIQFNEHGYYSDVKITVNEYGEKVLDVSIKTNKEFLKASVGYEGKVYPLIKGVDSFVGKINLGTSVAKPAVVYIYMKEITGSFYKDRLEIIY